MVILQFKSNGISSKYFSQDKIGHINFKFIMDHVSVEENSDPKLISGLNRNLSS